jgi:single-strand DNA-binding protein
MGSLNKSMLIGNVGKDPEVRASRNGDSFATFTLATSYNYKGADGNRVEQTEWHRIIMWRTLAEQAEKYVRKGRKLYIEGRLQTRSYDDQSGTKRYVTEIVAESNGGQASRQSDGDSMPVSDRGGQAVNRGSRPKQSSTSSDLDFDDLPDLPFDLSDLRK